MTKRSKADAELVAYTRKLLDQINALRRELAAMERRAMDCVAMNERQAVNFAKCQEELAEALKDAERYRWLRDHSASLYHYTTCWSGNTPANIIDAAIDAARREGKP